ncbi:Aminoglycoside acetyltransferase regulator [Slackia heliotrinireducens]|nr:Aminoglycoside acetyltransferase regulator [Slackia heliotrinireducens]
MHKATLPDGTVVAVKVQRPGIVDTVTNDLAIMERIVDVYDCVVPEGEGLSVKELVDEMVRTSTEELDFENEANNLERFFTNNESRERVTSPRCYRDYSTSAVLTEDFAGSPCVEKIDGLGLSDNQRDDLAYLVAHNYMEQFMEDGFYHADPHAGNVLVLPDDGGIEWIDFGMMGTMTSGQRDTLEQLILALVKGDAYGLKRQVLKIAKPRGAVDHAALLELCETMSDQFIGVDLESFDTGALEHGAFQQRAFRQGPACRCLDRIAGVGEFGLHPGVLHPGGVGGLARLWRRADHRHHRARFQPGFGGLHLHKGAAVFEIDCLVKGRWRKAIRLIPREGAGRPPFVYGGGFVPELVRLWIRTFVSPQMLTHQQMVSTIPTLMHQHLCVNIRFCRLERGLAWQALRTYR